MKECRTLNEFANQYELLSKKHSKLVLYAKAEDIMFMQLS